MLDHLGFNVVDFARSRAFYERALAPLNLKPLHSGDTWFVLDPDGNNIEAAVRL